MIVNPQLFNFRLIIGSLVIALVVLGSFSYSNYNTLMENQRFVEQEKKLVQGELSEMISQFEKYDVKNKNISLQLEKSKAKMKVVLDSLKSFKLNASLVSRYKSQIQSLKKENEDVIALINNLQQENEELKANTNRIKSEIKKTDLISKTLKEKNDSLFKANLNLNKSIEEAKGLTISNVEVEGVKRVTSKRIVNTNFANKANQLHVCFTLANNRFAEKGNKDLYIQILDPKNNIVADKGAVNFGKSSLIYSKKTTVEYNNEDVKVCTLIKTDNDEKLVKGTYFVNVFHNSERLGKTTIELK